MIHIHTTVQSVMMGLSLRHRQLRANLRCNLNFVLSDCNEDDDDDDDG